MHNFRTQSATLPQMLWCNALSDRVFGSRPAVVSAPPASVQLHALQPLIDGTLIDVRTGRRAAVAIYPATHGPDAVNREAILNALVARTQDAFLEFGRGSLLWLPLQRMGGIHDAQIIAAGPSGVLALEDMRWMQGLDAPAIGDTAPQTAADSRIPLELVLPAPPRDGAAIFPVSSSPEQPTVLPGRAPSIGGATFHLHADPSGRLHARVRSDVESQTRDATCDRDHNTIALSVEYCPTTRTITTRAHPESGGPVLIQRGAQVGILYGARPAPSPTPPISSGSQAQAIAEH